MDVGFADKHGARSVQFADSFGIIIGYTVLKHCAAGGRFDPGRIEKVLNGNRNAVERAAPFLLLNFGFRFFCGLHRYITRNRDVGIQGRLKFFDALQNVSRDFNGRNLPAADEFAQFCETRSEEHTSELQSRLHLVCRLLLEKKKKKYDTMCANMLNGVESRRG